MFTLRCMSLILVAAGIGTGMLLADEADEVFNTPGMQTLRITMNPAEWEALRLGDRTRFRVTVNYRDRQYTDVSIRGRNARGGEPRYYNHPQFEFDFARHVPDQRFFGMRYLNTKGWCCDDDTLIIEHFEQEMFRRFGLPEARLAHVWLFVNDSYVGPYNILDRTNEDMSAVLRRFFPNPNGNLYLLKNTFGRVPLNDGFLINEQNPEDPASYVPMPFRIVGPTNGNHDGIVALILALNRSAPEEIRNRVGQLLDLDTLIKYLAVDISLADTDGLIAYDLGFPELPYANNNTFFYHDPITNRFTVFPEDLDDGLIAFDPGSVNRDLVDGWDQMTITRWMLSDTDLMAQYFREVQRFVDQVYTPTTLIQLINLWAATIRPAVYLDMNKPLANEQWEARIEQLKQYVVTRELNIRNQLSRP